MCIRITEVQENEREDHYSCHHWEWGGVVRVGWRDEPLILGMLPRSHRHLQRDREGRSRIEQAYQTVDLIVNPDRADLPEWRTADVCSRFGCSRYGTDKLHRHLVLWTRQRSHCLSYEDTDRCQGDIARDRVLWPASRGKPSIHVVTFIACRLVTLPYFWDPQVFQLLNLFPISTCSSNVSR